MVDVERDINKAKSGSGSDLVYKNITGFKSDLSVESKPAALNQSDADAKKCAVRGKANRNLI